MQSLTIVLPCYNERENIAATLNDVMQWVDATGKHAEIVAVDDGSSDGTPQLLRQAADGDPRIRVVAHQQNQGYGAAVRTGCDAAQNEWIVFMDSDGQFHASDIDILLAHTGAYAFVTGRRRRRADPPFRVVFGKLLGLLIWVSFGVWLRDVNCGMKAFRRDVWPRIRPVSGLEKFFNTEMFLRLKDAGIPWLQVDVPHYPRMHGMATGGTGAIIIRMLRELSALKRARASEQAAKQASA